MNAVVVPGTAGNAAFEKADPKRYMHAIAQGATIMKRQSAGVHLLREPNSGALQWATVNHTEGGPINDASFITQIARTTDAGTTWQIVFSDNRFAITEIECTSDQHCCAIGSNEGSAVSNDTDIGAYIWCTADGGTTWIDTFRDGNFTSTLETIAAISPLEYWAVGTYNIYSAVTCYPVFYHTVDGGLHWKEGTFLEPKLGKYPIAIDCVTDVNCWVILIDTISNQASIAVLYDTNSTHVLS
jgi:photosystem II stability/assembly factor-like uncharacterized protein